jgi:diguanylate cyclase (GGDEF)-like protein
MGERQWFKSRQGLDAFQTDRNISFCGHAILEDRIFVVPDTFNDVRFADNPLVKGSPFIRFYADYPVHAPDGSRIGTLCIIDDKPRDLQESQAIVLQKLATLIDHEIAMISQATLDELTGISNRRGFIEIAKHVFELCKRAKHSATLVSVDLNGFKGINDTLGHQAGDDVLREFARQLLVNYRESDVVARIGGDEFCVLTSCASAEQSTIALNSMLINTRVLKICCQMRTTRCMLLKGDHASPGELHRVVSG